jgi:hypothetical protein
MHENVHLNIPLKRSVRMCYNPLIVRTFAGFTQTQYFLSYMIFQMETWLPPLEMLLSAAASTVKNVCEALIKRMLRCNQALKLHIKHGDSDIQAWLSRFQISFIVSRCSANGQ